MRLEDDLEGGEDKNIGGSRKHRKNKKRWMRDHDVVGSLRDMMIAGGSLKCMTAAGEDMKVGDPERVSRAGHRNGESCGYGMAV